MAVTDIIILQSVKGVIVSVSVDGAHSRTGVTGAVEDASPTNTARKTNNQYLLTMAVICCVFSRKCFLVVCFKSYRNPRTE